MRARQTTSQWEGRPHSLGNVSEWKEWKERRCPQLEWGEWDERRRKQWSEAYHQTMGG